MSGIRSRKSTKIAAKENAKVPFGSIIRTARISKHLSLDYVSSQIIKESGGKISVPYLHSVEMGKRVPKQSYFIEQIADILDINSDWLFYLSGRFPPEDIEAVIGEAEFKHAINNFRNKKDTFRKWHFKGGEWHCNGGNDE